MKKRKAGRPPFPEGESKDDVFSARFKPTESDALRKAAKDSDESPSELMHAATKYWVNNNAPVWVTSRWSTEDLAGKSVQFALYPASEGGKTITGRGEFTVRSRNPEGSEKEIKVLWKVLMSQYPLSMRVQVFRLDQGMADKIDRADVGEGVDFKISN